MAHAHAHPAPAVYAGRTAAQLYCLLGGLTLLLAGIVGFAVDSSFDVGNGIQGDDLILFEVNGIHNLVHIASGALLLAFAGSAAGARTVAVGFGLVYGLVTVLGLIDGEDVLGLIPVNTADSLLHLSVAAAAVLSGLMSRPGR
jgi:hypothetical protein